MRGVGPLSGGRAGVHGQHRSGPPAGEHHQIAFLPPGREERMRECVPQCVRVKVGDAGLLAEDFEAPADAVCGDGSPFSEKEPLGAAGVRVDAAYPQIPVDGGAGRRRKRDRPRQRDSWLVVFAGHTPCSRGLDPHRFAGHLGIFGWIGQVAETAVALVPLVHLEPRLERIGHVVDVLVKVTVLGEPRCHRPYGEVRGIHISELLPPQRRGHWSAGARADGVRRGDGTVPGVLVVVNEDLGYLHTPPVMIDRSPRTVGVLWHSPVHHDERHSMSSRYVTEPAVLPVRQKRLWITTDTSTLRPVPEVQEWVSFLAGADRSTNTVRSYVQKVTHFLNWADGLGVDWRTVRLGHLARYRWFVEMESGSPRSPATVGAYLAALGEFLRFCAHAGHVKRVVAEQMHEPRFLKHLPPGMDPGEQGQHRSVTARALRVRTPTRRPRTVTGDQIDAALAACSNPRDTFMLTLLVTTGMRVGELLTLRREDLHLFVNSATFGCRIAGPHVHINDRRDNDNGASTKTRYPRYVPTPPEVSHAYAIYMAWRDNVPEAIDCDYVFVNAHGPRAGKSMTYSAVKAWFDRLAEKVGSDFRPHMLRHTAATNWLHESGATLDTVQSLLGHASAASTSVYLHADEETLRNAVEKGADQVRRAAK
jgi:integrase/recombinase XerD